MRLGWGKHWSELHQGSLKRSRESSLECELPKWGTTLSAKTVLDNFPKYSAKPRHRTSTESKPSILFRPNHCWHCECELSVRSCQGKAVSEETHKIFTSGQYPETQHYDYFPQCAQLWSQDKPSIPNRATTPAITS